MLRSRVYDMKLQLAHTSNEVSLQRTEIDTLKTENQKLTSDLFLMERLQVKSREENEELRLEVERLNVMNERLNSMMKEKMNEMEDSFQKRLEKIRDEFLGLRSELDTITSKTDELSLKDPEKVGSPEVGLLNDLENTRSVKSIQVHGTLLKL